MTSKQVAAGAVVYNPETRKVLLLKHRLGHWAFPQGKQERSEKLSETLVRELDEETQLKPEKQFGPICEVSYEFTHRKKKFEKSVQFWAVVSTGNVVISSEHKGFIWVSFAQAKKLLKFENHLLALQKAQDAFKQNNVL